jgi:hypothetical protein
VVCSANVSTARAAGRHRTAPALRILLVLIALLAVVAVSRAGALDGDEAPSGFGTIGNTTAGSEWQKMTDDAKRGSRYVYGGPAGSELYKVSARLRGEPSSEGSQTVDVVVYADNGGTPGALLGQSTQNTRVFGGQAAGTVVFTLDRPVALQPGMGYWLMLHSGLNGAVAEYAYEFAPGALAFETQQADLKSDGPEDPAGPMGKDDRRPTVWGSYRPITPPPPPASDRDSDGTPDTADLCPDVFGPAGNAGCPASTTTSTPITTTPTQTSPATPGAPRAVTSPPLVVAPDSAQLAGIGFPAGTTRFYFEWGTTKALGRKTAAATLSAGAEQVELPLTSLRPGRRYFYELVAEGPGGLVRGGLQSFVSQPLPKVEPLLDLKVNCRTTDRSCKLKRSALDITLRGSDGQLARVARHAGLQVRLVLRQGAREMKRTFIAKSRARVKPFRGPGRVVLRRRVIDDTTSHYVLGGLLGGRMPFGSTLQVYVTRKGTTGGSYRYGLRRQGDDDIATPERSCEIVAGTVMTTTRCRNLT